jgi:hypothetical protein
MFDPALCSTLVADRALTDRTQKLKDARNEASKEIEAYKQSKERDFKSFESTVRSFNLSSYNPVDALISTQERHRVYKQA